MGFYLWTCIGIAVGIIHLMLPRVRRRVGAASAIALGVGGAWGGALLAATFVRGGWIFFGPLAVAGAIVGAVGAVVGIDLAAERMRDGRWGAPPPDETADRARLRA